MKAIGISALALLLAGCDSAQSATIGEAVSSASSATLRLTDDQRGIMGACLRGYANRYNSPVEAGQGNTECLKAYYALPADSATAIYAKAMHDEADAMFHSDRAEVKRLQAKVDAVKGEAFTESGQQW